MGGSKTHLGGGGSPGSGSGAKPVPPDAPVGVDEAGKPVYSKHEMSGNGILYAAAATGVVSDAGGTPASKWAVPLHETGPQCDKLEFFALYNYFKKMADELDTDVDFIMAQAAWESGWGTSRAAKDGYNLFGVNRPTNDPRIYRGSDDKRYGTNAVYDSYEEGIQAWVRKWGPHVKGAKTHDEYIDNLLKHGYNVI